LRLFVVLIEVVIVMDAEDFEIPWKKTFYEDEWNPIIRNTKKLCKWVMLNLPDFSMLMGWKRKVANIGFFVIVLYFSSLLLTGGITIWGYLLRTAVLSFIAGFLYSNTLAYMILKYLEFYQKKAEEVLNRS